MFEDILKELKKCEKIELSIPVETDDEGYFDKECPNAECKFEFKIHESNWEHIDKEATVYCPYCRNEASADSYWTTEQIERAKEQAYNQAKYLVMDAFSRGGKKFNYKQRNSKSFIKLNFSVGKYSKPSLIPLKSYLEMQQKIECEFCHAKFAFVGSAYFCPICGESSIERTLWDSLAKIRIKLDQVDNIKGAIESKDEAEIVTRSLIESGLVDGSVAFQKYSFEKFRSCYPEVKCKVNDFQIVEKGNGLWEKHSNFKYENVLSKDEIGKLNLYLQQRHLLSHSNGIVDERYIEMSQSANYKIGQRIVVNSENVIEFVEIIEKLLKAISDI